MPTTTTTPPASTPTPPPPLSPMEQEMRKYFIELVSRFEALGKFLPALRQSYEQSSLQYEAMKTQFLLLKSQVEQLHDLANSSLEHHDQN